MKRWLFVLLLLLPTEVLAYTAGSRAWIAEFSTTRVEAQAPFARMPAAVHQPVLDLSSGGSKTSAPFSNATRFIRITCEVPCYIKIGGNANGSSIVLPAMREEYFGVDGGSILSVMAVP